MKPSRFCRVCLLLTSLIGIACLPAVTSAADVQIVDIFDFKGTATDVGIQREPGQIGGVEYRIEGKFVYNGSFDLSKSTITFDALLDEVRPGGAGELLTTVDDAHLVPISLDADKSSEPDEAKYVTDGRFRPQFRVQILNRDGAFQFNIRIDRGLARRRPILCSAVGQNDKRSRTDIEQIFTIDDGTTSLVVNVIKPWECMQPDRYHMRAR